LFVCLIHYQLLIKSFHCFFNMLLLLQFCLFSFEIPLEFIVSYSRSHAFVASSYYSLVSFLLTYYSCSSSITHYNFYVIAICIDRKVYEA
jgi:hypothetical protein